MCENRNFLCTWHRCRVNFYLFGCRSGCLTKRVSLQHMMMCAHTYSSVCSNYCMSPIFDIRAWHWVVRWMGNRNENNKNEMGDRRRWSGRRESKSNDTNSSNIYIRKWLFKVNWIFVRKYILWAWHGTTQYRRVRTSKRAREEPIATEIFGLCVSYVWRLIHAR